MNNRELDALFALLRYGIGAQKDITLDQKESIKECIPVLYEEAKSHDLAHIVGSALFAADLISPENEYFEKFKKMQIAALYRDARMTHDLLEIAETFEAAGIPFVPLKGSVLRDHYPERWMRTSSDIDVLVHKEDVQKAVSLLTDQKGYTYKSKYTHDISLFSRNKFHIEVHFDLIEEGVANEADKALANIWELVTVKQGYKYWCEMPDEIFCLYHVAHAAKHLLNGGCGIKAFLDLWILENRVCFDAAKCDELLEKTKLLTFTNAARELAEVWFDGKTTEKKELNWLQNFVLNGGVYGTPLNHMIMQHQKRGGKAGYAVKMFFPSYDYMCRSFPFLEKYPWLTPIFYPVRWFKSSFGGNTKRVMRVLKTNSETPKTVDDTTQELLLRLGLK